MKVAVNTPTGNIGRVVTDRLLKEKDVEVVLLVRDSAKVEDFKNRGAQVHQGNLEDADFVVRATKGVDTLFWITPPSYTTQDFRAYQSAVGSVAARAIKENNIPRVINLSSIGAHQESGTGPVAGLHDVEKLIDESAVNVTHLRPAFFMENFLMDVDGMKQASSIFMPISGNIRLPMIATRDIAGAVVERILDTNWAGKHIRGLHGPADLTFEEAAAQISEGVGREVKFVQVETQPVKQAMMQMGLTENAADTMLELYSGLEKGLLDPAERRTPETTTPTTLTQFSAQVIKPIIGG